MKAVNLMHLQDHATGYGRMGHELGVSLKRYGYDVSPLAKEGGTMPPVALFVGVPTHVRGWWEGQRAIAFTMWETDTLPINFRCALSEFDMVCVPSVQNAELFAQFHPRVRYVPLGIDPEVWTYRARPQTRLRFLTSGNGKRKGLDLVVTAFRALRRICQAAGDPVPELVLRTRDRWAVTDPDITVISQVLDADAEVELYASAHCYVAASRGEGWGLQPLQAMAQGCPTILTDAHGHSEFSGYAVGIPATMGPAELSLYGEAGNWWEPDPAALLEAMLRMVQDYGSYADAAKKASAEVRTFYTWDRAVRRLAIATKLDQGTPLFSDEWHTAQHDLYKVVPNKDLSCDIGGTMYVLRKGVETQEPADVKRVLYEGGHLDPACIEANEPGLTRKQLERLGAYSSAVSKCPTCGQEVGKIHADLR